MKKKISEYLTTTNTQEKINEYAAGLTNAEIQEAVSLCMGHSNEYNKRWQEVEPGKMQDFLKQSCRAWSAEATRWAQVEGKAEPTELRKTMDYLTPDTLANICADLAGDGLSEAATELRRTAKAALCVNVGIDTALAMVKNRI